MECSRSIRTQDQQSEKYPISLFTLPNLNLQQNCYLRYCNIICIELITYILRLYIYLFYSVLFYSTLPYSILLYPILLYSTLVYTIPYYTILFYTILFYSIHFYSFPFFSTKRFFLLTSPRTLFFRRILYPKPTRVSTSWYCPAIHPTTN